MGVTYVDATVSGPTGREADVRLLVDSGATYSVLPDAAWKAIGLEPKREARFQLADGTVVERRISEALLRMEHGEGHSPVILGEPGDEGILGVVTLEILGLVLNPFSRTLHPMRMLLG
jgi:aspartyl protease family protein